MCDKNNRARFLPSNAFLVYLYAFNTYNFMRLKLFHRNEFFVAIFFWWYKKVKKCLTPSKI